MIYFAEDPDTGLVKIGHSANPKMRIANLRIKHKNLTVIGLAEGERREESIMHGRFYKQHVHGEWFRLTQDMARYFQPIEMPPARVRVFISIDRALKRDINVILAEDNRTMPDWVEEVLGAAVRKHKTAKEKRA